MSIHPDDALYCIQRVKLWGKKLSEADTRVKIIDEILKKCLGWTESDIVRETSVESGYIDYVLSVDGIPRFVIEAKKSGDYFEIPLNMKNRKYKIGASISKVEHVKKAMEQARNYCLENGAKYGIVTNGSQFIIFEAFVEGKSWRQQDCIVYNGFQEIEKNIAEFINTLGKHAVRLNSLRRLLHGEVSIIKYTRPLDSIHNKDETLVRNHLAGIMVPFVHYTKSGRIAPRALSIDEYDIDSLKAEIKKKPRAKKFLQMLVE
jgi:predicted type IV restriction endonuclease